MTEEVIRELRRNHRNSDMRIKAFCVKHIPAEIFHYTLSQMRAINTLYSVMQETGKGVKLKTLAEKLSITAAAASEMVETLVRKNAITRKNDPEDRRAIRLYVCDELVERFEKCEVQLDGLMRKFLNTLTGDEVDTFISVSRKFAAFTADPDNFPEVEE